MTTATRLTPEQAFASIATTVTDEEILALIDSYWDSMRARNDSPGDRSLAGTHDACSRRLHDAIKAYLTCRCPGLCVGKWFYHMEKGRTVANLLHKLG